MKPQIKCNTFWRCILYAHVIKLPKFPRPHNVQNNVPKIIYKMKYPCVSINYDHNEQNGHIPKSNTFNIMSQFRVIIF